MVEVALALVRPYSRLLHVFMSDFVQKMFIFRLSLCTAVACLRSSLLYSDDCSRPSLLYSSYLFQAKLACNKIFITYQSIPIPRLIVFLASRALSSIINGLFGPTLNPSQVLLLLAKADLETMTAKRYFRVGRGS